MYFEADFAPCAVFDWTNERHLDAYWALHEPFEKLGIDFWWLDWCCDESRARAPGLTEDTWINSLYARRSRARGSRWPAFSRIGSSYWAYFGEHEPGAFAEHRQTIHFTGDTAATWEILDFQSRFTVAEGNLGLPYVSHDIGSFKGKHLDDEMYVRWLQAGAFGPLNRLHSNHGDRLPWEYSGAAARIGADFLRLRGSLVPFLYTLAREAHDSGLPMARGMYLRWPAHEDAYRLDRQYMLGDSLLVAPVGEPGDPATKQVWFPPGEWIDFFSGERIRGPRVVELSVPLARMPVFARAGAVVPSQPYRYNEAEGAPDQLVLTAWSGADGSFRLYEDAGDGREYRRGARAFTRIVHDDRGPRATRLTIGPARGDYAGKPARRRWRLRLVGAGRPSVVRVNGRRVSGWAWDGQTHALTLTTPKLSTAGSVRIDVRR
jgi:alpha-glucosidase (family GH31 glycosyl hydrolase)